MKSKTKIYVADKLMMDSIKSWEIKSKDFDEEKLFPGNVGQFEFSGRFDPEPESREIEGLVYTVGDRFLISGDREGYLDITGFSRDNKIFVMLWLDGNKNEAIMTAYKCNNKLEYKIETN